MNSRVIILCVALLATVACNGSKKAPGEQEARERSFQQMMSGVTLVGQSTRWNKEGVSGEERYIINKVSKLAGDTWLFQSRLKYGSHDLPAPIPLAVKWAGDTPVITLTDVTIPGVGTYTARVLLYRDQYAGTWSGKDIGGQLFGKIVRNQP